MEDHQLIEDSRELNMEFFVTSGCFDSFREGMPVNDSGWDSIVYFENNLESNCKSHINGGSSVHEWVEQIMDEMCKNLSG